MKSDVEKYIKRIYFEHDYEFFRKKCREKPKHVKDLISELSNVCKKVSVYAGLDEDDDPSVWIMCEYDQYKNNQFCIGYDTSIEISKVAPFFAINHSFFIDNIHPRKIELDLFNVGDIYTSHQRIVEETVTTHLSKYDYRKLKWDEEYEVIDIEMPKNNLFGPQMTVGIALFKDVLEIACRD